MVSMKQARLLLSKAQVRYAAVYPDTGSRIHIRSFPGDIENPEHFKRIEEAFKNVGMTALRVAPLPKLPFFAGQWVTYKILIGKVAR